MLNGLWMLRVIFGIWSRSDIITPITFSCLYLADKTELMVRMEWVKSFLSHKVLLASESWIVQVAVYYSGKQQAKLFTDKTLGYRILIKTTLLFHLGEGREIFATGSGRTIIFVSDCVWFLNIRKFPSLGNNISKISTGQQSETSEKIKQFILRGWGVASENSEWSEISYRGFYNGSLWGDNI